MTLAMFCDRSPYLRGSRRGRRQDRDSTALCPFSAARIFFQKPNRRRLQVKLAMRTVLQGMEPCGLQQCQD